MSKGTNRVNKGSAKDQGSASAPGDGSVRPAAAVEAKPDAEAIRRRAYELYLERTRTGTPGDERADWARAERELSMFR